jgi:ribosomal protein L29
MKTSELRTKKPAELVEHLITTRKELNDARRGLAAGELTNPRVITAKRRLIAQINTIAAQTTANEEKA